MSPDDLPNKEDLQSMSKQNKVKIAIVVPCFNNFLGLAEMLHSVKTKHEWYPIIKDNWRENRGCSKAWNQGFEQAVKDKADYILIVNDDILFSSHAIDALVEEFEKQPEDVILFSAVNVAASCPTPETVFDFPRQESNVAEHPDFSCFMVKPDFQEKIGKFDENFWPAYFEDNDTHRRINLLGYKALCTSGSAYYHVGSVSVQKDETNTISGNFENNRNYFIRKWGGNPEAPTYDHPYNDSSFKASMWLKDGIVYGPTIKNKETN